MIDSHCHLAGDEFVQDLLDVIGRARDAGLTAALVILAAQDDDEIARWARVHELWPETRAAVGVHPHQAGQFAADPAQAARLLERRLDTVAAVRAIGEIGLDYHYDFAPRDVQQAVFREQLAVARARDLPVVIHTREAEEDTLRILGEAGRVDTSGVFHCFTGDAAAARRAVETGYFVSIPGIVSFPRSDALREAVREIPADRLLVETDSPYLAPVPYRGKRNEPAHVVRVAEAVAVARGMGVEDLEAQVARNFDRLFRP